MRLSPDQRLIQADQTASARLEYQVALYRLQQFAIDDETRTLSQAKTGFKPAAKAGSAWLNC